MENIEKNTFELLNDVGIHVEKEDRYDPYFITYDFEALQVPLMNEKLVVSNLHFEHVPATVSICSNVPNHTEPIHLVSNGDAQELCDKFVAALLPIQATKAGLLVQKFQQHLHASDEREKS